MRDKYFLDTNIIIYAYSVDEIEKSEIANNLISESGVISTQVINELNNILLKKFKISEEKIFCVIKELENNLNIVNFSLQTQKKALYIKQKYKFQYYDSSISTALENDCKVLYSEDMQHNQIIENKLKIVNPFLKN